ncbi:hypothetical protein A9Q89_04805 [Gammaproteobacteria bacterium 53_120_T64]|nr:hypothetical protein A9Q89_04805 [Gammaproteobacteria bacterium 53_120_T64]
MPRWPLQVYSSVIVLLMGCLIGVVNAAEYSATAQIEAGLETDNNVRLVPDDEDAISGYRLSPDFTGRVLTPTLDAKFSLLLDLDRFDDSAYDTDDQDLKLSLKRQWQTDEFGVSGGLKRDSTRTSELQDTGRISNQTVRKETASVSPYWLHTLDQRHSVRADFSYQDVEYASNNYSDYEAMAASFSWLYQLTERTALQLQFHGSNFETDGVFQSVESDAFGLRAGFETAITERLQLNVLAGASRVDTSYLTTLANVSDDQSTATFVDAKLNYSSERSRWGVQLSSDATPSGDGYLRVNNRISTNWVYQLSPYMETTLQILYGENESLDDRIQDQRDYANIEASVRYRLSPKWNIIARYRHRQQDRENQAGAAESDALFLTLRYYPSEMTWSR